MNFPQKKTAIIIGAGPGGLTAAYELLTRTDLKPIILEKTNEIGGLSRTVNHKGNLIDIGGHRFFSKSKRVMEWWKLFLPIEEQSGASGSKKKVKTDKVMLIRNRVSRIYFLRKFFDYPITLNFSTLKQLGLKRILKIAGAYTWIRLFPIGEERNLEEFFINRFGRELYITFFKDYTEKVWGVPCSEIKPEWGAQRIKGLSISKALLHALKSIVKINSSVEQKNIETSLIEKFLYPKYGPGQLWQEVASTVIEKGGKVVQDAEVVSIKWIQSDLVEVVAQDRITNQSRIYVGNYLFSTMPIKELINRLVFNTPDPIRKIANGLVYRDFITVGLLLDKLKIKNKTNRKTKNDLIPDNWLYIQESDVSIGRLQIFNNWSPFLVNDPEKIWIGLEYFCNEGDRLWTMEDEDFIGFAVKELIDIDIIQLEDDVVDSTIIRVPKAYPAYFGTYDEIGQVIEFTKTFDNMFLVGRNGMHKYNNQDHSMLSAMTSVDNIVAGRANKDNIWNVNTEKAYHEDNETDS